MILLGVLMKKKQYKEMCLAAQGIVVRGARWQSILRGVEVEGEARHERTRIQIPRGAHIAVAELLVRHLVVEGGSQLGPTTVLG